MTGAAQHLRARLYLRSLRARNRSGFASSNHGESQLLLHQQLQHQLLTLKGQYDVSEMQARPSWGTTRPAESPNRQLQLLHWVQLMLLLQCCARILQDVRASHEDVHALDREQHRHAVVRRRSPGSEIGGTATPRPAQRSRQPAWQASHPAFCVTGGLYAYVTGTKHRRAPPPPAKPPPINRRLHTHGSRTPPRVAHHKRSGRASVSDRL